MWQVLQYLCDSKAIDNWLSLLTWLLGVLS